VNNFSEVSTELVDEMNIEIDKGNNDEAKQNSPELKTKQTRRHHRKRHVATQPEEHVQKEPTEINALVDEYLRLANHGQWQKTNRSMQ